jgi:hypothetical protein
MIIRKEQFSRYLQEDEDRFIGFICQHLRKEYPRKTKRIAEEKLRQMVVGGLARARRYKLTTDEDLMAFVAVMMEIAPNFDEQPDLHHVLTDVRIPVNSRFDTLFIPSLDEAWEQAAENDDQTAWFQESTNNLMN